MARNKRPSLDYTSPQKEEAVEREPTPGKFVRVVEGVVVEGPVELVDEPDRFFNSELLPGEWFRVDGNEEVQCHWVWNGGSFEVPPPIQAPEPEDPVAKLTAFLNANPDVKALLEPQT